jgi:hypothetical protein
VAHAVHPEAELREHAARAAVRLTRDRDDAVQAERAEALGEHGGGGLGRVAAAPVVGAERIAERDVGTVGGEREEPGLADEQAALALDHRPEGEPGVLLLRHRALEGGAGAGEVARSAEQPHRAVVAVEDGVELVQIVDLVGAQDESLGEDRERHQPPMVTGCAVAGLLALSYVNPTAPTGPARDPALWHEVCATVPADHERDPAT